MNEWINELMDMSSEEDFPLSGITARTSLEVRCGVPVTEDIAKRFPRTIAQLV